MKFRVSLMLLIAASLVVAVAVAGCETASAPAPSPAPEVGAKSESATGTVVAAGVHSRCSASPTIPWEEGSELTEVRGSAQGAELWALIFGRVPLRAEEEAKISFRMTGSDPLKLVALGPDGEPVFPRQGPRKHLGSDWERPGEEWGSTFVLPKSGCWRIMVSRGAESGYVSLMVRGAEGGKEGEEMAAPVDVEREAELYPQAPPPEDLPSNFEEEHPGSSERECVYVNPLLEETGRDEAIRSGQFVAGPFTHFVRGWVPQNENKLWFAPLHTERMPGAVVRAIPLMRPEEARTVEYRQVGWTVPGGEPFYPGAIRLPEADRWRLIAISGPDWGCFELTLPGG